MYFPFLFGRRSELLALRYMLDDHRPLKVLVPVIEPVKLDVGDLTRCVEAFGQKDQRLAVILNPDKHEFKAGQNLRAWRSKIVPVIATHSSILPTYRCSSPTTFAQVTAFLKEFNDREVALAYSSPALADAEVQALARAKNVRFHIVLGGKMSSTQQGLLPHKARVDIRDYYNKQDRNSDYAGTEYFTDRQQTYKPSWVGFGDYASIGAEFTAGGGPAAAVAIHAIYKHPAKAEVWIEHFVSDDIDMGIGDTASKFLQAAKKLVKAAKSRPNEFGSNFALDEYAEHVHKNHSPGLGANKTLQIDHHICLMLDVLSGAV